MLNAIVITRITVFTVRTSVTIRIRNKVRFFTHLGEEFHPERDGENAFLVDIGESPIYFVGGELETESGGRIHYGC